MPSRVKICLKERKKKGRKKEEEVSLFSHYAAYKATEYDPGNKYEGNEAYSSVYLLSANYAR